MGIDVERKTFDLIKHECGLENMTFKVYQALVKGDSQDYEISESHSDNNNI